MSSKNTYYFSHDANAHEDDKIVCLMSDFGAEGYGWWWILVEILFQKEGCRIDLSKKSTVPYLQRMLWGIERNQVQVYIDKLIEYELLEVDGDYLYSPSLLKRAEKLNDLRDKRRAAAEARWGKKREKDEKKEAAKTAPPKENKNGIQVLQDDIQFNVFAKELISKDPYKLLGIKEIMFQRGSCLDWMASKGVVKKDYKAFFRNWLRKRIEDNGGVTNTASSNKSGMVY